MTGTEIIEKYLKDNGYAGLIEEDSDEPDICCCEIDDLMCCGFAPNFCVPAYAVPCDGSCGNAANCGGHLSAEKGGAE
jgi:hypothetical protein